MMLYAHALHYICIFHNVSCIINVCLYVETCVLLGLDWDESMMLFSFLVTCSCTFHAYVHFHFFILVLSAMVFFCFFLSLSLSLSLSLTVCAWHLSANPLHPGTLFVLGHHLLILLLFMSSFMLRMPVRTSWRPSPNVAFIRNAT